MNKAVFLDRDGVINHDHAYVHKIADFRFIDGVFDACRHLQQLGYVLVVVTNQSGIGRGMYSEHDFAVLTQWMLAEFQRHQVDIKSVYFCPHHPEKALAEYQQDCACRKPNPGMLQQAVAEWQIDVSQSLMIGDKADDMRAAAAAGVARKILVRSGQTLSAQAQTLADEVWDSLADALQRVQQ